jgi:hypothetical protein
MAELTEVSMGRILASLTRLERDEAGDGSFPVPNSTWEKVRGEEGRQVGIAAAGTSFGE